MIITNSDIGMSSKHSYEKASEKVVSFSAWKKSLSGAISLASGETTEALPDSSGEKEGENESRFSDSLDDLIKRLNVGRTVRSTGVSAESNAASKKVHYYSFEYLWQMLFGGHYGISDLISGLTGGGTSGGFGGSFTEQYYYHEEESTSFSTTGTVKTSDGREINFNLELSMSRSFTEVYSRTTNIGSPIFTDPLVINLDCDAADVSDQKFYFDLDADGHEEAVSRLNPGSGFLALDKNGDGKINDGSELFGAKSGNGFADLAKYDSDGNGWIDEADEIFKDLMIWSKDRNGNDRLIGIGEAGVGAIYLGSSPTDFSLNNMTTNEANARIRSTGIFLYENGGMGTMQQLDLAQ